MYALVLVLCMVVLPVLSWWLAAEKGADPVALAAQWYVVWAVGARLTLAGLSQILRPRYTARTILALRHDESLVLVRELGFANLALGLAGLACAWFATWVPAVALAGAVFYGLAGLNHLRRPRRGPRENLAMATDLLAGAVLGIALGFLAAGVAHP